MSILYYIVTAVYYIFINLYGARILNYQKISKQNGDETLAVSDGKLLLTGLLGGSLGIFLFTFIKKYRLKSLFLMVIMPVLLSVNLYILYILIRSNFSFIYGNRLI